MIESTSPSYPLMATLDMNADLLLKNDRLFLNAGLKISGGFMKKRKTSKACA